MNRKLSSYRFTAVLLGSLSLFSVASANDEAIVQKSGNVSYVSGGVGAESIVPRKSKIGDFNLKLVFALNNGEYLSGVRVVIADVKGKTVLDTTSDGPWLLARLPTGTYQIVATLAGKAVKRQVAVGSSKIRTIDFRWGAE
jgi:hypothetical protein